MKNIPRLNSIFWLYTGIIYKNDNGEEFQIKPNGWKQNFKDGKLTNYKFTSNLRSHIIDAQLINDSEIKCDPTIKNKEQWEENRPIILKFLVRPLRKLWSTNQLLSQIDKL